MKRLICVIMLVTLAFCAMACGKGLKTHDEQALYTVQDATGVNISFKEKPHRILPLGVGVPDIVMDITGPERIVALPEYFSDAQVSFIADKAKKVQIKTERIIPVEQIMKLKPDLVLAPYNADRTKIETMRSMGIKVFVVKAPHNMQEIEQCVLDVSEAVGEVEKGKSIVQNMKSIFELIKKTNSSIPVTERKKILAVSVEGAFGVKGGLFDDLCHYAYIENAAGNIELPTGARIGKEGIVKLQPDVILLPTATRMMADSKRTAAIDEILHDPSYMTLKAVQNKQIIALPDKYYRYCVSHYAAEAAYVLASSVYPQYYKQLQMPRLLAGIEE